MTHQVQIKHSENSSQYIRDLIDVAVCKINLTICQSTWMAIEAVTIDPNSPIVVKHRDVTLDAYSELQADEHNLEMVIDAGTLGEWDALTSDEQNSRWDRFHELCALGRGEEMYFYGVMMKKWMVGYCGH